MVHLMKLKKSELPEGWKVLKEGKNWVEYKGMNKNILVHKDGDMYWFDWGMKDKGRVDTTFIKDKSKVKSMLRGIMKEEFVMRRN